MSSVHRSTALPGQCCLCDNIHPRTKQLCSTNLLSNQVSLLAVSHVWGNTVGKVAFVTLWTMILTGVSGAKKTIWKDVYSHKCISVSSEGIVPIYLNIPLANPTREWCHIGDRVSASGAAGHSPALAVTLTWVKGYTC